MKTNSIREAIEALAEQWEKEVRGTHPENTRSYWEGRADALNDLRAILATHPEPSMTNSIREAIEALRDELASGMIYGAVANRIDAILAAHPEPPREDAEPPTVTIQSPKIDFVLDLSQAEADRLGPPPPAPKVWRCRACEQEFDSKVGMHIEHITDIAGSWCSGLVDEVKPGE